MWDSGSQTEWFHQFIQYFIGTSVSLLQHRPAQHEQDTTVQISFYSKQYIL